MVWGKGAQNLRGDRVVEHDIHVPLVDFINRILPFFNGGIMSVEQGGIKTRISVETPRLVHERGSCNIDTLKDGQYPECDPGQELAPMGSAIGVP